jgi:hypothetical protein
MISSLSLTKKVGLRVWAIATAGLLIGAAGSLLGQEASRTVERSYQFDARGDATIQFSFQLGAAPWAKWKEQYGDHPDILLRNVKYQLAAAVIEDFGLDKDDINRKAVAKFKARALARYLGDGQFQIDVPKNMKLVTGSGQEWVFTDSMLEDGGIVNITDRAKLPPNARDAHLTNGTDFDELVYTLDVSPAKPKALLYLGIVCLVAAAGLGGFSLLTAAKSSSPSST